MASNITPLTLGPLQLDALREAAMIGAGHAATALSQLTHLVIRLQVPRVSLVTAAELKRELETEGNSYICVAMGVLGDISGQTVQIYPREAIRRLSSLLLDGEEVDDDADVDALNELQQSTLTEVSNIIVGAYLDALSRFMPLLMFMSTPTIWVRELGPVLNSDRGSETLICFHTDLNLGDEQFSATFLLMPNEQSVDLMLRSLHM